MDTKRICPKCGTRLAEDAPESICPRCLLQAATGESASTVILPDGSPSAPSATDLPALRYFGDYELLEELARGGMGIVYKARQTSLNRLVAVKMILAGRLASPEAVRRFRAEAEAAANLQHPNIVAIHEVGEHEGQHYFSMDYVEGRNLAQTLAGKPLPPREAAELLETIAKAIHYGHQRGTLHRDLKPQNILIDASRQSRITDFGLAKRIDEDQALTQPGTVLGSPSYMPPEQAAGRQDLIGPQSDVYSLGAILYELLTGQPPFRAETAMATMIKVRDEQPAKLTRLNADVPRDLETICLKALEKRPERRYSSASALGEDLRRFLNREPILARPISFARQLEFWARKHPWTLIGAATLGLIILLGFSYYLWEQNNYLRWVNLHPDFVRKPGVHTAQVNRLKGYLLSVYYGWTVCFLVYLCKSRRLHWTELWSAKAKCARLHAIKPGLRQIFYLAASAGLIFSLYVLSRVIQKSIWEDPVAGFGLYFTPLLYVSACAGCAAAGFAWAVYREQHAVEGGEGTPKEKAVEMTSHPPIPRKALWKVIALGAGTFFILYFMDLWLPGSHAEGGSLSPEFLAGFVLGATAAFSSRMITPRRVLLLYGVLMLTTGILTVLSLSNPGRRGDYFLVFVGGFAFAIIFTCGVLRRTASADA